MSAQQRALLLRAYAAYNRRDVEALVALVSDTVDWPDDDGGRLRGPDQVRAYWTQQWARTHTHDEPVALRRQVDGRIAVDISQVVRAPDGSVISRGGFRHLHRTDGDRIAQMDIEAQPPEPVGE